MHVLSVLNNCAWAQLVWKELTLRNDKIFMKSLHNFMVIMKYRAIILMTVCFFHCRNLLQYLKSFISQKAILRKGNLKLTTVTSTKGTRQIPKKSDSCLWVFNKELGPHLIIPSLLYHLHRWVSKCRHKKWHNCSSYRRSFSYSTYCCVIR